MVFLIGALSAGNRVIVTSLTCSSIQMPWLKFSVCTCNELYAKRRSHKSDPIDYDTNVGVSRPILIDSTSNEDPSTDSTLLSSSVPHDSGAETIPTVSKESAGNKNSNAVLATTCAGDIALSPTFPPVQPKRVQFQPQHSLIKSCLLT